MGEKKSTFERENPTIWQEKIRSIGIQLTSGNADFQGKLNGIRLEIQIEVRMGGKQRHLKEKICEILTKFQVSTREFFQRDLKPQEKIQNSSKFDWRLKSKWKWEKKMAFEREKAKFWQNFKILHDKIRLIRVQMTSGNAEFNGELKEIRLKIQIEVKIGEKNIFQRENLQNFRILKGKMVSIGIKRRGEDGELHGVFWNVCDMWGFHFYLEKALPFLRFFCLFNDLFFLFRRFVFLLWNITICFVDLSEIDACFWLRVQCGLVLIFYNYWFCFLGVGAAFFVSGIKKFFVIFGVHRGYNWVFSLIFLDCWKFIFGFIELQSEKLVNCACVSCVFIMFQVVLLVIITDFIGWANELMLTTIVFCFSQCFLESIFCVTVQLVMLWSCLLLDFSLFEWKNL